MPCASRSARRTRRSRSSSNPCSPTGEGPSSSFEEVDPTWSYYHEGNVFRGPIVWRESVEGDFYGQVPAQGGKIISDGPAYGDVLIVKTTRSTREYVGTVTNYVAKSDRARSTRWHVGAVTIYIPTKLDRTTLDVARDALDDKDRRKATEVLQDLGPYAGIGGAIIEAQAKGFAQVARGKTPTRQLQHEIDEFLRERGWRP